MFNLLNKAAVAAMLLAAATAGSSRALGAALGSNPVFTDVYTADPAPLVVSNTVYIYTGHDEPNSGFYTMNNWLCYSSQNMTNWTSYGSVLSYTNFTWGISNNSWASQCVQKNGRFYWYVALRGAASYGGFNIGVAVSDSPTGPFVDARGTPLITDGMTTGGDAWDDIDPTVFTDTNGVSWLGWGHGTFYLVQLATNMTDIAGSIQAYHLPYYTEGPFLHRHGNLYYLSYASSVNGGGETIRYATATNITGPWTPRGLITGYAANSYTIQDGIFDFNGQSYMVYHNATLSGGGSFDRSVCLDYLYYNPDGTIQPVFQTTAGLSVPPRNDNLTVGLATNSWPASGATNIPWSPTLRWLPGSNAVAHAVYVGTSSNAVAQATFASPEYQGTSAMTNFTPAALAAQTLYFWRVDEIRGTNMSHGAVGSFTTGPLLAHRYSFTESGGTSIADSAGGAAWTGTVHNGGTLNGAQLTLSAASQQYVSFPAGLVSSLSGITLMAWVNLSSNANWCRIFDFGNGTGTRMYLTSQNGSGTNSQFGIVAAGSGGEQSFSSSSTLSTGVWHQVAVTLSGDTGIPGLSGSGGNGVLYLDGVAAGVTENLTLNPMSLGSTPNNYIGKSQSGTDPYLNGSIDEFRIYNGALKAADIAQAYFAGPTQLNSNSSFPWMTQDIGAVGATGSATFNNGVFTATGTGADIWGAADAFRYVYVPATGNCTMVARVITVQNSDLWAKAGIMIRESLDANAANACIAVTPGNGVTWQYRSSAGATTANAATNNLSAPYWVKLVRSGNTFTGYRSPDGAAWTQQGTPQTFSMASTAYIGLAVTSHNNSTLCMATFDNVTAPGWLTSYPPPAPASLAATVTNWSVGLTWPASSNALSYNVKRAVTSGGPYATLANVTTTNYTDAAPINGTNLYYVVSALNLAGESTNSVQASVAAQMFLPSGLSATPLSATQVSLVWNAFPNATSYNVKRSAISGGPYTNIASGVSGTNYTDTGVSVLGGYYYVVSAMVGGSETPNSAEAAISFLKLTGGIIGTSGSYGGGNTITNVFDNNLSTFFDGPAANDCWAGLDFGVGVSNVITQINYCPRSTFESRMVGGIFQGANSADFSDAVALYTVGTAPTAGVFTSVSITNTTAFRYARYLSPNNGWGNVAEVEFYGYLFSAPAPVPSGLSAAAISGSQVSLAWNVFSNTATYKLKRSTTNGGPYGLIASGLSATNYLDSGLARGTPYYYVVSAVIAGIETPNSTQATATTLSPFNGTWTNDLAGGTGNWSVAANWNVGIPMGAGDSATLGVGTGLSTVRLDQNATLSSVSFTNANSFVVADAGNILTLDGSGSGARVNVTNGTANAIGTALSLKDNVSAYVGGGKSLSISGVISNAGAAKTLTVNGPGTLALSGNNSYAGGTTLNGGQLNLNSAGALGSGPFTNNAGSARIDNTSGQAITLTNNNAQYWNADMNFICTSDLNLGTGAVTLNNGHQVSVANGTLTVGGAISISGSGALTNAGPGTLVLLGTNTYTNDTWLLAGTLTIGGSGTLGGGGYNGVIANNGLFNYASSASQFVTNGMVGTGALMVSGSGNLTLLGANTYSGSTLISSGSLCLGAAASLASTPYLSVVQGAVLDVSAVSGGFTLAGGQWLAGGGTVVGDVTVADDPSAVVYPGGGAVVATNLTFGGNLSFGVNSALAFDLSGACNGANDSITLSGPGAVLNGNGASIYITCYGSALDTHDYVLFNLSGAAASVASGFNSAPVWLGYEPQHSARYSIVTVGKTVVLHYEPMVVTVMGVTVKSKPYDGNTTAALDLSGAWLVGVYGGDTVQLDSSHCTASFASAASSAGSNNVPVTVTGLGLSGAQAPDYWLAQPTGLTGNILAPSVAGWPYISRVSVSDGNVTLIGTNVPGSAGHAYEVWQSPSLMTDPSAWTPVMGSSNVFELDGGFTNTFPASGSMQFYIIEAAP